jgi:arylformamidase
MPEPIDISLPLHPDMPVWPGSPGVRIRHTRTIADGNPSNESKLEMDVHCGTHVEGPLHFIDGAEPVGTIPMSVFVGPAHVEHLRGATAIGPNELASVPPGTERLLLRTSNSDLWRQTATFRRDYVALTLDGAKWIADRGIKLVGVDYLSVQRWGDDPETHRVLMRAGVAILEGIDLSDAPAGDYRLTCLPLRLESTEAAPARAILEPLP